MITDRRDGSVTRAGIGIARQEAGIAIASGAAVTAANSCGPRVRKVFGASIRSKATADA